MANVTVEVKGLSEIGEALKKFPEVIAKKYLHRATFTAAAVIEQAVKTSAPVRTGALRDHIAIFKRKSDANSAAYAVGVRAVKLSRAVKHVLSVLHKSTGKDTRIAEDAYYWKFLEFGTSKMKAQPFMRPAFESQKYSAVEVFKTTLADGVQAAAAEAAAR